MESITQKSLLYPEILWERPVHYYKAKAGKVFILAGSKSAPQRSTIACEAVFRSGTGILTLGFPDSLKELYKDILPNTMTLPLPSTFGGSIAQISLEQILEQAKVCDVALVGPGLSTNAETVHLIWDLIFKLEMPVVLDDDAILALAKGIEVLRSKEGEDFLVDYFAKVHNLILIITVDDAVKILHSCKLEKYPKATLAYVKKHKKEIAEVLSQKLNATVIIKGEPAILAASEKTITNLLGHVDSPVLAGMVTSFIAQNPENVFEAAATAIYLHGYTEGIAKESIGERIMVASDIIRYLPRAIKELENS